MLATHPRGTCERILAISGRIEPASAATIRKIYTRAGELRAGRQFGSRRRNHAARAGARIFKPSLGLEKLTRGCRLPHAAGIDDRAAIAFELLAQLPDLFLIGEEGA